MECIRWPKALLLTVLEPFQVPSNAGWAPFPAKRGVQNGRSGVSRPKKKQVGLFRRIFTPTFQKINSHVSIRSVVRDLAYPLFGLGPLKLSRIQPLWAKPMELQRSVRGCPDQKKTSWPISTYFHPTFSKQNQRPRHNLLCSSRSGIPHFWL